MVRDACRACYWGPNGTKQCEIRSLPPYMRGESCAFWDMARRFGVRGCATCKRYGPDADEMCICHVYQCTKSPNGCHVYQCTKSPNGYCDLWEEDK